MTISTAPNPADVQTAFAEATALLSQDPAAALARAEAILKAAPGQPAFELIACEALRHLNQPDVALPRLRALSARHPAVPAVQWELGQAASAAGATDEAIGALERLTRQQPAVAGGWFLLGQQLRKAGRDLDAWRADLAGVHASSRDPDLLKAALAMKDGALDAAFTQLTARLEAMPDNPPAMRMLAEISWRRGDMDDAIVRLERTVAHCPGFDLARDFLVRLLLQTSRLPDALAHAKQLNQSPFPNPGYQLLLASVFVHMGDQEGAEAIYLKLLANQPDQPQVWQNLGHVQKTLGKQAEAIDAYRQAVSRRASMGGAWWSLANLKTVKLTAQDIAAMETALSELEAQRPAQQPRPLADGPSADANGIAALMEGAALEEDIFHLHFSLGKAYEDAGDYPVSFSHYEQGNRLRRALILHDADDFAVEVAATADLVNAGLLSGSSTVGCPARDPIFIVGMPRAGSTLVEQILSSHSQIEGTMELPDMMMMASRLKARVDDGEFPDFKALIMALSDLDRRALGEEYLERTRIHRKSDKPMFIDKMPNNWQHVALIRLILPNATIIDARRHPLGCCFSAWKQHFARGQLFSYDLTDVGRYYRDYVTHMAAFDRAAPGTVHRVIYEQMVADTETQVRALLAHVGVPFEEACLSFWNTRRAVRTASSEQVRQPIYTDGVDHWRHYEAWLDPLKAALGDVLDHYPAVPPGIAEAQA